MDRHQTIKNILERIEKKYQNPRFERLRKQRSRNDANFFRSYAMKRADGKCEICGLFCPYILEIHHIKAVKDGGSGNPDNLICLCPNCHAIITKTNSQLCENPHFEDWIYDTFGDEIAEKLNEIAYSSQRHTNE